jgi:hypothetical protein
MTNMAGGWRLLPLRLVYVRTIRRGQDVDMLVLVSGAGILLILLPILVLGNTYLMFGKM